MTLSGYLLAALLVMLAALTACNPANLLNASVSRNGYSVTRDVVYGENPRQKLDIYVPDGLQKPAKVVVFYYGGSWQWGDKKDYLFVAQALVSQGFVVVIPNYRISPEVVFPAFLEDSAAAFVWVHKNIGAYQGNSEKLYVMGHSAGAYNAMMITLDTQFITSAGGNPAWIKGVIGLAGPYDFLPLTDPKLKRIFEVVNDMRVTQPITYANHKAPPMFLATGDSDTTVKPRNTLNLSRKLRAHGTWVEEKIYPDIGHIGIILGMAEPWPSQTPVIQDVTDFIHAH